MIDCQGKIQAMFLRESVQLCSKCQEVTPHSYRRIALPKIVSAAAVLGAGVCAWRGGDWYVLAVVLVLVAMTAVLRDRERMWGIRCERCRTKRFVALRRTKPALDRMTVFIDF